MKKVLMIALLAVSSVVIAPPVSAWGCDQQISAISGLNETAVREMVVACEKAKLDSVSKPEASKTDQVVDNLDKYSDISMKFAKALGVAAKELGLAVNDFVNTFAGKITIAFIAYHLFGSTLVYVVVSIIGLWFIHLVMKKLRYQLTLRRIEVIETTNIFGNKVNKEITHHDSWGGMNDSANFWYIVSFLVESVALLLIMVNLPI